MVKLSTYIFIIFACVSCKPWKETPTQDFLNLLNKDVVQTKKNVNLNLNGFYNNITVKNGYEKSNYFAFKPVFFYGNGLVELSATTPDSAHLCRSVKSNVEFEQIGNYEIIADTIKAIIYCEYEINPHYYTYQLTYFTGILKDNATIEDWKMVRPYPNVDQVRNEYVLASLKKSSSLKFKLLPCKAVKDSNATWISKYKLKETR